MTINREGPQDSPEFKPLMVATVIVCTLGFLAAIFPFLQLLLSILFATAGVAVVGWAVYYILHERRLDREAFAQQKIEERIYHD